MSKKLLTENVCEKSKTPCQNNGTCIWNEDFKAYYCECVPGFTNDNCTELMGINYSFFKLLNILDYDPCASAPCQNNSTCAAKAGPKKSTYECFCLKGFSGNNCELSKFFFKTFKLNCKYE